MAHAVVRCRTDMTTAAAQRAQPHPSPKVATTQGVTGLVPLQPSHELGEEAAYSGVWYRRGKSWMSPQRRIKAYKLDGYLHSPPRQLTRGSTTCVRSKGCARSYERSTQTQCAVYTVFVFRPIGSRTSALANEGRSMRKAPGSSRSSRLSRRSCWKLRAHGTSAQHALHQNGLHRATGVI